MDEFAYSTNCKPHIHCNLPIHDHSNPFPFSLFQRLPTIFCLCALVIAEPQVPSKNYLPPEEGYNYSPPSVPFPSPSPSPTPYYTSPTYRPSSPRPRPPSPIYSTVSPTYPSYPSSSYTPTYTTPKPYPRPTYGPPPPQHQSGGEISPVGTGGGEVRISLIKRFFFFFFASVFFFFLSRMWTRGIILKWYTTLLSGLRSAQVHHVNQYAENYYYYLMHL